MGQQGQSEGPLGQLVAAIDQRGAAEEELPTVKVFGRPNNEIYGVAAGRGEGWLFATAQGLLPPNEPATHLPDFAPTTDHVEPKRLPPPPGIGTAPTTGNR